MDAFDADVLIYAASPSHALGRKIRHLFPPNPDPERPVGVGSLLLVPELLSKPQRLDRHDELKALGYLLGRLELRPVDRSIADAATVLAARHRLRAAAAGPRAPAVHLATAVLAGADRFITNNRKDFPTSISEIDVTYPSMLPEP